MEASENKEDAPVINSLKRLPQVDETWSCYGRHAEHGRKKAFLVWQRADATVASTVAAPDAVSHARALSTLVESQAWYKLPREVRADDAQVARILGQVLAPLGVTVQHAPCLWPAAVDGLATDFVLGSASRAAAPRWTTARGQERLQSALASLRLDEAWLHLPMNLAVVVEDLEPHPFGLLVHADCCPGFTILPLDASRCATIRPGTVTIRLQQSQPFGLPGRWPTIVEELATRPPGNPFTAPQRRLSPRALERLEASIEIVLGLDAGIGQAPATRTLVRYVDRPVVVRLSAQPLGVISTTLPLAGGEQHVRLRAA